MADQYSLSWLHLSDLHACRPESGWDSRRVLKTLREDLKRISQVIGQEIGSGEPSQQFRPDLLFFTGDLAFGHLGNEPGKTIRDQFHEAAQFLNELRNLFQPAISVENVFIVPGNHDVDRSLATDDQTYWLDNQKSVEPVQKMIHNANTQWKRLLERLDSYCEFLKTAGYEHLLTDPKRLIYSTVREVNGVRVGIAGFNSAWSCSRDGENGKLWLAGRWQAETLHAELDGKADVLIALIHHPGSWYVEFERNDFWRHALQQNFNVCLHGHEHDAWVEVHNELLCVAAAACYDRSDRPNGYNIVRLDFPHKLGEVWLREYTREGGGWRARVIPNQTNDRGVWTLSNIPWLRRPNGGTPLIEGPSNKPRGKDARRGPLPSHRVRVIRYVVRRTAAPNPGGIALKRLLHAPRAARPQATPREPRILKGRIAAPSQLVTKPILPSEPPRGEVTAHSITVFKQGVDQSQGLNPELKHTLREPRDTIGASVLDKADKDDAAGNLDKLKGVWRHRR